MYGLRSNVNSDKDIHIRGVETILLLLPERIGKRFVTTQLYVHYDSKRTKT
jgi:hypothetical protein